MPTRRQTFRAALAGLLGLTVKPLATPPTHRIFQFDECSPFSKDPTLTGATLRITSHSVLGLSPPTMKLYVSSDLTNWTEVPTLACIDGSRTEQPHDYCI